MTAMRAPEFDAAPQRHVATPPGPKGYVCEPPAADWERVAAANRALLERMNFHVEGVPATELRRGARRRVLALAGVDLHATGDGAAGKSASTDPTIVLTGHQPQFYHPGIWVKAFTVAAEAERQGAVGINVAVDHDAGELAAEIPWRASGPVSLGYTKEYLVAPVGGRPLETLPPPSEDDVESFLQRIEAHLTTLEQPRFMERYAAFAGALRQAAREAQSAAEVGYMTRALYEEAFGEMLVPDVPVSRISQTPEFLLFFVHWARNADAMRRAYNDALVQYRREYRVRSQANPFPDLLEREDQGVELPFWGLTPQGIRRKLYARQTEDGIVLSHLEGEYARLPREGGEAAVQALLDADVQVRPRAVPLTVFHRLFVADLFVHGTGGGRYDEVTDKFIENVFGVPAPTYAVVSATLHLPLGELPVQPGALRALRRKLRDLRFNPQRYAWELEELSEELVVLLRRKEELIEKMRRADAVHGERARSTKGGDVSAAKPSGSAPSRKRILTREIERVNAALYAALRPVEEETRRQLAALEARAAAGAVATRRTYPFFLYDPADVWELPCVKCDGEDDGGQLTFAFPSGG